LVIKTIVVLNTTIRFMLADDHPAFRNGVAAFLRDHFTDCSIDEAAGGYEVLEALNHFDYDIFFIDIVMPDLNGIETTKKIIANHPDAKVIALSFYEDETSIIAMFESGVKGYLNKNAGKREIIEAVESVLHDSIYISNKNSHALLWKQLKSKANLKDRPISQREKEILLLICKGFSTKEIAGHLHLSTKTVENHRNHLLEKTAAHNTASLVLYAAKKGWV